MEITPRAKRAAFEMVKDAQEPLGKMRKAFGLPPDALVDFDVIRDQVTQIVERSTKLTEAAKTSYPDVLDAFTEFGGNVTKFMGSLATKKKSTGVERKSKPAPPEPSNPPKKD